MTDPQTTPPSRVQLIEGLAAQLYAGERPDGGSIWWHLVREDVRAPYREKAVVKITDYESHVGRKIA